MLQDKIDLDLKEAMRARDAARVSTLRFLKAAMKNAAIEKRTERLEDADVIKVLQKQVKQRQDSIEGFEKGNRVELAEKEKAEQAILEGYLPKQLSDDELETIVRKAVEKTGVTSKAQMGTVIKEVMAEVQGRADGRKVSALVARKLTG